MWSVFIAWIVWKKFPSDIYRVTLNLGYEAFVCICCSVGTVGSVWHYGDNIEVKKKVVSALYLSVNWTAALLWCDVLEMTNI